LYNDWDTSRREWSHIEEFNFEQMVLPLGKMLPAGGKAARAVFDAITDMAWTAEAVIEDASVAKIADGIRITFHADGMSVCEKNIERTCAALSDASALRVYLHDADTFCLEVSIPCVFAESDATPKVSALIVEDERDTPVDTPLPDWLLDAANAVKAERDALSFEDFTVNHEQMLKLADVCAAVKALAERMGAAPEFTKPNPPRNMHGGTHIVSRGTLSLDKDTLHALVEVIELSGSFSISSTDDGRIYLSFWVNDIYLAKE